MCKESVWLKTKYLFSDYIFNNLIFYLKLILRRYLFQSMEYGFYESTYPILGHLYIYDAFFVNRLIKPKSLRKGHISHQVNMVGTESKLLLAALQTQRLFGHDCNLNHCPTSIFLPDTQVHTSSFIIHRVLIYINYNYFKILDSIIYSKFMLRFRSVLKAWAKDDIFCYFVGCIILWY